MILFSSLPREAVNEKAAKNTRTATQILSNPEVVRSVVVEIKAISVVIGNRNDLIDNPSDQNHNSAPESFGRSCSRQLRSWDFGDNTLHTVGQDPSL